MRFVNVQTGIEYNVTNEALIPSYEADERFEKVTEKNAQPKEKEPVKATKTARK